MTDQLSLFGSDDPPPIQKDVSPTARAREPLAGRMRPRSLDEIVGQEHLLGPDKVLRRSIQSDHISSMILWGPPGSGKSTLAEVIAHQPHARFVRLSAVTAGVADLRKTVEEAKRNRQRTILFIDEIHRFNKAQQDAVLPHVEHGVVTLIGATTENPSFEVNSALLSRTRVYTLAALNAEQIVIIIRRALHDKERGLGQLDITVEEEVLQHIAIFANGDARTALNVLELAAQGSKDVSKESVPIHITLSVLEDVMQHLALLYDKGGVPHYDTISALHKSLRGSAPDAILYWLARMLEAC